MMTGHTVSGYMLWQMEFDADRHEARLAGSDVFQSTARQLVALNVANQGHAPTWATSIVKADWETTCRN